MNLRNELKEVFLFNFHFNNSLNNDQGSMKHEKK